MGAQQETLEYLGTYLPGQKSGDSSCGHAVAAHLVGVTGPQRRLPYG